MLMTLNTDTVQAIVQTLKREKKGWDLPLFECSQKVSNQRCEHCKSVCCDAVELGCDHDDNDVFLYCHQCLNEMIQNHNNQCPINGHKNPIISPNRVSRRQILKSTVFCPYSSTYMLRKKQMTNLEQMNDQIIDTIGADAIDQKEGQKPTEDENQCGWKGTLHELIHNHLEGCAKRHDPVLVCKLEIERLKQHNLQIQNVLMKQIEYNTVREQELSAKVKTLQNELDQCQAKLNETKSRRNNRFLHTHPVACSVCKTYPIKGARFVCAVRDNYNLCEECESALMDHNQVQYPLIKMSKPCAANWNIATLAGLRVLGTIPNAVEEKHSFPSAPPLENKANPVLLRCGGIINFDGSYRAGEKRQTGWILKNATNNSIDIRAKLELVAGDKEVVTKYDKEPVRYQLKANDEIYVLMELQAPSLPGEYIHVYRLTAVDDEEQQICEKLELNVKVDALSEAKEAKIRQIFQMGFIERKKVIMALQKWDWDEVKAINYLATR
mmetsp:Transcript_38967/g.62215  ORF Transcript_38967/g.62215 Transcript_38967/m.62215 type:complete len:496 (+) Transcript_38967:102-1589(+)